MEVSNSLPAAKKGNDQDRNENSDEDKNAEKVVKSDDELDLYFAVHLNNPKFPALVREHLDAGALAKLVKKYYPPSRRSKRWTEDQYPLVLIAACAMQLGCILPPGFRNDLKSNYQRLELMDDAEVQIRVACDEYINGKPYNLGSVGLLETANLRFAGVNGRLEPAQPELEAVPAEEKYDPAKADASVEPRIIPYHFWFPPGTCENCGATEAPDGTDLKRCGDCHQALFCCSGCLKWGYDAHAGDCDQDKVKERFENARAASKAAGRGDGDF